MNLEIAFAAGLTAKGYKESSPMTRHRVFVKLLGNGEFDRYFVGRSGALRHGRNLGESIPCGEGFRRTILAAGQRRLEEEF